MAIVAIEESAWDKMESKDEDAMRWANADLALGIPAKHDEEGGATWWVWSHAYTLDQVAYWGCLWENIARVGKEWEPPKIKDDDGQDTEVVDRVACEAEIQALLADAIVPPEDIVYAEGDNVWQVTLDAQGVGNDFVGFDGVPVGWIPTGGDVDA